MGFWTWLTGNEQEEEKATAADEPVMEVADVGVKEKQVRPTREIERQIVGRRYRRDLRIDGDKLRKAIFGKGLTAREVSLQMGRAQSFVSTNCADGFIKTEDLVEICEIIGATPDDFIVTESKSKSHNTEMHTQEFDLVRKDDIAEIKTMLSDLIHLISDARVEETKETVVEENPMPQKTPEWAVKPTYKEFAAYCASLDAEINAEEQWERLENMDWKIFDWKRSINGVYSAVLRRRKKMIPMDQHTVAEYFVSCGMVKNVAAKEASKFINYYEKRGWYPKGFPNNPWLPKDGWKTYAAKWARNHFEWKGETA